MVFLFLFSHSNHLDHLNGIQHRFFETKENVATKGRFMSLLNNFNHQIHQPYFMILSLYGKKSLPIKFAGNTFKRTFFVEEILLPVNLISKTFEPQKVPLGVVNSIVQ